MSATSSNPRNARHPAGVWIAFTFIAVLFGATEIRAQEDLTSPRFSDMDPNIPDGALDYMLWQLATFADSPGVDLAMMKRSLRDFRVLCEVADPNDPNSFPLDPLGDVNPRVSVELVDPNSDPNGFITPQNETALLNLGGEVLYDVGVRAECLIPVRNLIPLAKALEPGTRVGYASLYETDVVVAEGPIVENATSYRDAGFDGTGVKVAVFDSGFRGLTTAQSVGNNDAPANNRLLFRSDTIPLIKLRLGNIETVTQHGTACLEVVYDHAPNAQYSLHQLTSVASLRSNIDLAKSLGVSYISCSMSWFNQGWRDGSGDVNLAVNRAGNHGILYFNSAGNYAQRHYQATFRSPDGDMWHEFSIPPNKDETLNVTVQPGSQLRAYLQWDRLSDRTADYDLYVDFPLNTTVARSTTRGNSFESLAWTNRTGAAVTVDVCVGKVRGANLPFELLIFGGNMTQYRTPAGSVASPANSVSPWEVTVGAVGIPLADPNSPLGYLTPPSFACIEGFSSRGNTNSGARGLDIVAPDRQSTLTYGPSGFAGTSCSTPSVCGLAVMLNSGKLTLGPSHIRDALYHYAGTLKDWGAAGRDSTYGYGGAVLPPIVIDVQPNRPNQIKYYKDRPYTVYVALLGQSQMNVSSVDHTKTRLMIDNASYVKVGAPRILDVNADARNDALYGFVLPNNAHVGSKNVRLVGEFTALNSTVLPGPIQAMPWAGHETVTIIGSPGPGGETAPQPSEIEGDGDAIRAESRKP